MTEQEEEQQRRADEFRGPIAQLAMQNNLIARIVTEYALGYIVTKEEAMAQMIVGLARNWDALQKRQFEQVMSFPELLIRK